MLARVDARRLREDAGIRAATVAAAFGVPQKYILVWETGRQEPRCDAGRRWARFIRALEAHAEVTAEAGGAA